MFAGLSSDTPVVVTLPSALRTVTAGDDHACALTVDSVAYCWGNNTSGQLGSGGPAGYSATPQQVAGVFRFATLVAGSYRTCGLLADGSAWCWGTNGWGQLGDSSTTGRATPVRVAGNLTFASLVMGGIHTCGISRGGAMYCWGANWHGELGNGTSNFPSGMTSPVAVVGGLTFRSGAASYFSTCGLAADGTAYCWGDNTVGELGSGRPEGSDVPVPVAGGVRYAAVTARENTVCAVAGTQAWCWGDNSNGQFGNGSMNSSNAPVIAAAELSLATLSVGSFHACGVTIAGAAYCWGWNLQGQLGDGTHDQRLAPSLVFGQQ